MKNYIIFAFLFSISLVSYSQEKTVEKRTTTDSTTGNVTTTESVIISSTEDITPRNNMLIINPLKFFLFYNLTYYHKISPTIVVGGGLQIPTIGDENGVGINAEIRIHPSKKALRGFYIAPNFSYSKIGILNTNSAGILLGWQWFPGDEFAIGLGIGIDRYFGEGGRSFRYRGTLPALRFDIGYAW